MYGCREVGKDRQQGPSEQLNVLLSPKVMVNVGANTLDILGVRRGWRDPALWPNF